MFIFRVFFYTASKILQVMYFFAIFAYRLTYFIYYHLI